MQILIAIDTDEERAVSAAEVVAELPCAAEAVTVTLLNVKQEIDVRSDAKADSSEWYDETDLPSSVDEAEKVLKKAGVTAQKRREHGDPADTIIAVAEEIDADRIVLSGRKRTPVGKVLFGSVTQSVILNTKTPVTVFPPGK